MDTKRLSTRYIVIGAGLLAITALGSCAVLLASKQTPAQNEVPPRETQSGSTAHYENTLYGIAFDYPTGYILEEGERGDGHRAHYNIVLIRKEDSAPRENSEGPTAITFDLYQNDLDKQTLVGWLRGNNTSNYKLSNGTYASTSVDGREAILYRWSGLYEGETTAFLHKERIVAVAVTFITPEDENIGTYRSVLSSLRLSN